MLLDTHALYWLASGVEQLSMRSLAAIGEAQAAGMLLVSPISAWELSIAAGKPAHKDPPEFGEASPDRWFSAAVRATTARVVPIGQRIAVLSAVIVAETGHKDPGDCFLIATSRMRGVPIITRDAFMLALASSGSLTAIEC